MSRPHHPVTKFHAPATDRRAVRRSGLLNRLPPRPRVLVVAGAAGSGKTTLIGQWLAAESLAHTWVSLDEDDNGLWPLWAAVTEGLERSHPGRFPSAQGAWSELRSDLLVPVLDGLADLDGPHVLVLDDLHVISDEKALSSLDWWVARLPPTMSVAITTRMAPRLPMLDRARAAGLVVDIGPTDLRLARTEVDEVLTTVLDRPLEPEDRAHLDELTQGWTAAVMLAGIALGRGTPLDDLLAAARSPSGALAALVRQVLLDVAPADRELLLGLAVLERFDRELLVEVLDDVRAWEVATDLAERTGLVAQLEDGRWWRLHDVVRASLDAELTRTAPARRSELHRRASRHFGSQGDLVQQVHHLLAAEEYDALAAIAADVDANLRVPRQHVWLSWLSRIPGHVRAGDPRLCFWEAWAAGSAGDRPRRDRALAAGREAAAGDGRGVPGFADWHAVELFVRSASCYDDVGTALATAEEFLDLQPPDSLPAYLVRGRLGGMLQLAGRNREALDVLGRLTAEMDHLPRPHTLFVPTFQALAELELGDIDAARRHVRQATQARTTFRMGPDPVYAVAHQAAARLHTEQGDPATGLAVAREALELTSGGTDAHLVVPGLLAEVARALLALGERADAAVAVNQARQLIEGAPDAGALPARLDALAPPPRPGLVSEALSQRELEVLVMLPSSLSASEIASELFISPNTVRTHIKSIYRKLGVSTRGDAVAVARSAGLVSEARGR